MVTAECSPRHLSSASTVGSSQQPCPRLQERLQVDQPLTMTATVMIPQEKKSFLSFFKYFSFVIEEFTKQYQKY